VTITLSPLPAPTTVRTYLAIDLENLLGRARASAGAAAAVLRAVRDAVGLAAGDLAVLAANAHLLATVGRDLPFPCRLVIGERGADGADQALVGANDPAWIAGRFDRVVIASGDHYFLDLAEHLRAAGVDVVIVGRHRSIHHGFWRIGCEVIPLGDGSAGPSGIALAA